MEGMPAPTPVMLDGPKSLNVRTWRERFAKVIGCNTEY